MAKLIMLPLAVFSVFLTEVGEAHPSLARNLFANNVEQLQYASKYLQRFGYASKFSSVEDLTEALKIFQKEMGLSVSGEIDQTTLEAMKKPRCGGKMIMKRSNRVKRFAHSSRWEKLTADNVLKLKWFISRYTNDMPAPEIRSIVRKSFALWSTETVIHSMPSVTLLFEEAKNEHDADITILWAEGDHGDEYRFDDGGDEVNILAHTFYPNYHRGTLNGDIHLDDAETWTSGVRYGGTTFANVFIHEIGHALGLGHSKQEEAIMFPVYKKNPRELEHFDLDDKCAINWNYIGPSNTCLFVWIMSEIVKHQIDHNTRNGVVANNIAVTAKLEGAGEEKVTNLKKRLKQTSIPRCRNDNDVREKVEKKLLRELNIQPEAAREYSRETCQFLNGLHREYHQNPASLFEKGSSEKKLAQIFPMRLKRHLRHRRNRHPGGDHSLTFPDDGTFDSKFFNDFLSLYAS